MSLRIIIVFLFLTMISVKSGRTAIRLPSDNVKRYEVIFGESYHNYLPDKLIRLDVVFKNNSSAYLALSKELVVLDTAGNKVWNTMINLELIPNGNTTIPLMVPVPKYPGIFTLTTGNSADRCEGLVPSFEFNVVQPKKSPRLTKILVYTPDYEDGLNAFLKTWGIKAPMISWGQVLLCGEKTWTRFSEGDPEITQLIARALKREMSVIFLDFGASGSKEIKPSKILLPYGLIVNFIKAPTAEKSFVLKSGLNELAFGFTSNTMKNWNGSDGHSIPDAALRFEGSGVKINAFATAGNNPERFPVVELIPNSGKGKLYISQVITQERLTESVRSGRYKPASPAYDPMAVQFLLNLISATVGDNLLK